MDTFTIVGALGTWCACTFVIYKIAQGTGKYTPEAEGMIAAVGGFVAFGVIAALVV